jgi:integrase
LSAFDAAEAEKWLCRLREMTTHRGPPLAASTQRRAFSTLSGALDTATRDGLIAENPLKKVARPRAERVEVPFLRAEAVEAAVAACHGRRVRYVATVAAYTGARISELLALNWTDVDLTVGRLTVQDGKSRSARRAVPLVSRVVDCLTEWKGEQSRERAELGAGWHSGDAVFTTRTGARLTVAQARRDLQVALRAAGLESRRPWHTLRHSVATRLLADGLPMPMVSAILGHASIAITVDIYGHLEPVLAAEHMERALA